MNAAPIVRPSGITVIAWLWVVSGVLVLLLALLTWLALSAFSAMPSAPARSGHMLIDHELIESLRQYGGLIVGIQAVFGVLSLYAGVQLLKLRAWARTIIEILSWLSLAYVVTNGVFFLAMWNSIVASFPKELALDSGQLQIAGIVTGAVLTVVFAVPLWLMIRYLRGPEARSAVGAPARKPR